MPVMHSLARLTRRLPAPCSLRAAWCNPHNGQSASGLLQAARRRAIRPSLHRPMGWFGCDVRDLPSQGRPMVPVGENRPNASRGQVLHVPS